MKLIETYKSTNFNERNQNRQLMYLILHYTAMRSCKKAIEFMCDKKNKVSSHFLISKKGEIFYLVDLDKRAWHAGISYWKGLEDLNSHSIGIEIENSGHHICNENYDILQINSLCNLIKILQKKYNIFPENVLGHSDIAPYRKIDPGEKFPWHKLQEKKLSYFPRINIDILKNKFNKNNYNYNYKQQDILSMLELIGYDTRSAKIDGSKFRLLIQAYQRHYRQSEVLGEIDEETFELIKQHYKDVLT